MSVTDIWPATHVCSRGLYHVLTLLVSILVAGSNGSCVAGALDRIAPYIGNDDHIPLDLALPFDLRDQGATASAVAADRSGIGSFVCP
jgi:hypothetical protein